WPPTTSAGWWSTGGAGVARTPTCPTTYVERCSRTSGAAGRGCGPPAGTRRRWRRRAGVRSWRRRGSGSGVSRGGSSRRPGAGRGGRPRWRTWRGSMDL
ncbi:MAG: FIG00511363: hypothetical protein, partial [uncultured Nocardioides sp.]